MQRGTSLQGSEGVQRLQGARGGLFRGNTWWVGNLNGLTRVGTYRCLRGGGCGLVSIGCTSHFNRVSLVVAGNRCVYFVRIGVHNRGSVTSPVRFISSTGRHGVVAATRVCLSSRPGSLRPEFSIIRICYGGGGVGSVGRLRGTFRLC